MDFMNHQKNQYYGRGPMSPFFLQQPTRIPMGGGDTAAPVAPPNMANFINALHNHGQNLPGVHPLGPNYKQKLLDEDSMHDDCEPSSIQQPSLNQKTELVANTGFSFGASTPPSSQQEMLNPESLTHQLLFQRMQQYNNPPNILPNIAHLNPNNQGFSFGTTVTQDGNEFIPPYLMENQIEEDEEISEEEN